MNIHTFIGSEGATILWWQMCIRALAIFLVALLLVRMGKNRIYGKFGSLDIVLAVILGSILSRTLTANAPFLATIAAAFTLVAVHNLMIKAALYSKTLGHMFKGREVLLVEDGHILHKELAKAGMTEHDLKVALRSHGLESPTSARRVYLERNGQVSVIT